MGLKKHCLSTAETAQHGGDPEGAALKGEIVTLVGHAAISMDILSPVKPSETERGNSLDLELLLVNNFEER